MKALDTTTLTVLSPNVSEIQTWMAAYVAELLGIQAEEVEMNLPFDRYGLDSSAAVGMTGDMEDWLGLELDPTLLYDYPTIAALAQHLATEVDLQDL